MFGDSNSTANTMTLVSCREGQAKVINKALDPGIKKIRKKNVYSMFLMSTLLMYTNSNIYKKRILRWVFYIFM